MIKSYPVFSVAFKVVGLIYGIMAVFAKGDQHYFDMIVGAILFATGLLFDILIKLNEKVGA